MSDFIVNAAIQLLPIETQAKRWDIVDRAILLIQQSQLKYKVCPFETVIEGKSKDVFSLIEKIKNETLVYSDEILINIKIHAANKDLFFDDKLEKY